MTIKSETGEERRNQQEGSFCVYLSTCIPSSPQQFSPAADATAAILAMRQSGGHNTTQTTNLEDEGEEEGKQRDYLGTQRRRDAQAVYL